MIQSLIIIFVTVGLPVGLFLALLFGIAYCLGCAGDMIERGEE